MFQLNLLITVFLLILNKCSDASVVFNQCGTAISRYQFILQSPDQYPANINCEFILEGHHSCATEFHFQLVDFDTPFSSNCTNGLEIIGHETLCGILTGVRMYKTHKSLHLRIKLNKKTHFKIVITRIPCSTALTGKTYIAPSNLPNYADYPNCCADSYNSRKFFLASPGFPQTNQNDCIYKIYRANPNICRLRINARFFNIDCNDGFLEIDSKKICGCQSELDIISQFDQFWGSREKVIRYKNSRTSQTNYNGFVIEVIQDECPTRYSPSLNDDKPQFYYYNDQLNRVRFPLEKNAETLTKNSKLVDYYFFRAPDYDDANDDGKDREERNYFESTDPNGVLPKTDVQKCNNWGFSDLQMLMNEVLWQKMPKCFSQELKPTTSCIDVHLSNGYLISSGYPFYNYPPNVNCCYRFHRLNNFCGIHFSVLDFQLEASYNCDKDALILYNKYKYCGTYLYNKYFKFDLSSRKYEEIKFQTDAFMCNKGFKIYFEHIPCASYQPPVTTNAPTVAEKCGGNVRSEIFDLTISNMYEECVYVIHKINQDVCGVKLRLLELNLSCEHEYLLIKDREYCGRMSGETKWATFDPDDLMTIAYRRRIDHRPVLTSIMLRGQQITEDCDPFILDVPAQRRLKIPQD